MIPGEALLGKMTKCHRQLTSMARLTARTLRCQFLGMDFQFGQRYEHKYTISLLWSTIYLLTHSIEERLYSTYTLEVSSNHSLSYGLQHFLWPL